MKLRQTKRLERKKLLSAKRLQNALTEIKRKTEVQNCKPTYIALTLSAEMGDK